MKGEGQTMSEKQIAEVRQSLESTPDIEETADLMNLAGNSTRLKLLYLLDNMKELCVCDLADMLGVSVSAVSQHLSKLKAYVKARSGMNTSDTVVGAISDHLRMLCDEAIRNAARDGRKTLMDRDFTPLF